MDNYLSTEFFIIIIILSVSSTRYQRYRLQKSLFLMKTLLPVETHFGFEVISFQRYFDLNVRYHATYHFGVFIKVLQIKQERLVIELLLQIIIVAADRLATDSIAIVVTLVAVKIGTYFYCFTHFLSQNFNKTEFKTPKSRLVIVIHN